jgi:proteasome alpha subunit
MGGTTDPISAQLKNTYRSGLELGAAVGIAVEALQATATPTGGSGSGSGSGGNGAPGDRVLEVSALEVAVLDRTRPRRTFRRITGAALRELLPERNRAADAPGGAEVVGGDDAPAGGGPPEESSKG